jgi:divalent metal cation (Fe/Co/Zn/Cd) transporter
VSSSVVYFGRKYAMKPPDEENPYGHVKAEPAIILILTLVATAIFVMSTAR